MQKLFMVIFAFMSLLSAASYGEVERYDLKLLTQYQQSTLSLKNELDEQCVEGSSVNATSLWTKTAQQWFLIKGLGLPALEFLQLDHKIIFWPDSKDRLRKQVNQALATSPELMPADSRPASVMSLSAVEYIQMLERSPEHCVWLTEIMTHQLSLANQLYGLQKYYDFATFEQVTALHTTVMLTRSQLKEVLSNSSKINWALAPGWRSNSGWPIIQALATQIQSLFIQLEPGSTQQLNTEKLLRTVEETNAPFSREQLEYLDQQLVALAGYVEQELAPSLDVFIGFNNFDGD